MDDMYTEVEKSIERNRLLAEKLGIPQEVKDLAEGAKTHSKFWYDQVIEANMYRAFALGRQYGEHK